MKKQMILDFSIFGYYIVFETNDTSITELIYKLYGNIINNNLTNKNMIYRKVGVFKNNSKITVINGKYTYEIEEWETVDYLLEIVNTSFDLFEKNKYIYLHGSVVAKNRKCTLFIAPTMQGKTTLCTQMVLKGYTYLSDDLIILDKQCKIYPFVSPIKFRNNIMLAEGATRNIFNRIDTNSNTILSYTKKPDFKIDYFPDKIVFLNRHHPPHPFNAKKVRALDSINKLICNAAFVENSKNHIFISKKISECVDTYDVYYNEYEEVFEFLQII